MPAGIHPIAPAALRRVSTSIATANLLRDGTGTISPLLTAGANGSVVPSVHVRHLGAVAVASSPMVARLWHRNLGAGTWYLYDEVVLPAATPATAGTAGSAVTFAKTNIALAATDTLGVTISVAESVGFSADIGDY